jgi:hypothetical protein
VVLMSSKPRAPTCGLLRRFSPSGFHSPSPHPQLTISLRVLCVQSNVLLPSLLSLQSLLSPLPLLLLEKLLLLV